MIYTWLNKIIDDKIKQTKEGKIKSIKLEKIGKLKK